jgi:hypothetical protein
VRVARRLRELPRVRAAFGRGELSYSKVRALTRIEAIEREGELLELAQCATAAQLERIVRGYRAVARADADRAWHERYLTLVHDDDGSIVVRGRLPRDEGAILLRALEAARDRDADPAALSGRDDDLTSVPAGTLTTAPRSAMARRPDDASREPASDQMAVATRNLGVRNADALVLLAEEALAADDARCRTGAERYQVVVHVDANALSSVGDSEPGDRCELDDRAPVAAETARRLCCDASIVTLVERDGEALSMGRKTRRITPALRRALRSRDGGCRFPGCTQRRWTDAHHIQHWAHGGATAMPNLVQLCRHHHRLVHEGGFSVERAAAGALRFRRPDGRAIATVPTSAAASAATVIGDNRRRGLRIGAETCVPRWCGEPLDLPAAVDAVLTCTQRE